MSFVDTAAATYPQVFDIDIKDITLTKSDGVTVISILPQFFEISIYQSIFNPLMKAELVVQDYIGLHTNYPVVGEEIITITYTPTQDNTENTDDTELLGLLGVTSTMTFVVNDVREIEMGHDGRSSFYVFDLYSVEMWISGRTRLQREFNDTYTNLIQGIVQNDLKNPTTNIAKTLYGFTFDGSPEPSSGIQHGWIPNLKPLEAIKWMTKRAVPQDNTNSLFVFFERFEGFFFSTLQSIIKKNATATLKHYYYLSNYQDSLVEQFPQLAHYVVTAEAINKRYSTYEKMAGGYFENEYFQVDVFNKNFNSTTTNAVANTTSNISGSLLNTNTFIANSLSVNSSQTQDAKTKIKYVVCQNLGDDPSVPTYIENKYGNAIRSLTAFSQVTATFSAPGDTRVQAGDIITLDVPELHGFNIVNTDKYISGNYLIVNIKHLIRYGNKHSMVMDLHRDSYSQDILTTSGYDTTSTVGTTIQTAINNTFGPH